MEIYAEDTKAGRIYLGDITSDGYPDVLLTIKYLNGTTRSHIIVNQACDISMCS